MEISSFGEAYRTEGCVIRAAQVKLVTAIRIKRPLQLLYPLKLQDSAAEENEFKQIIPTSIVQRSPKRKAAIKANQKIKNSLSDSFQEYIK